MDASFGKLLIYLGLGLAALGVLVLVGGKLGLGQIPGDVVVRGARTTVYFPVVTCLILSLALTLVLWLVQAWRR
jgi:hypothetical protein